MQSMLSGGRSGKQQKMCMTAGACVRRLAPYVLLALADDHNAAHLHRGKHLAHHVHGRLVRRVLVALRTGAYLSARRIRLWAVRMHTF